MTPDSERYSGSEMEQAQRILMSLFTIARHLRPSGMTTFISPRGPPAPRHVIALFHLATKGPMSVSELATSLGVTLTTASLSVTQMAESGLVVRSEDPSDHRRTIVAVSREVQPALDDTLTTKLQKLKIGLEALGPERAESLLNDLEVLLNAIEIDAHNTISVQKTVKSDHRTGARNLK